MRVIQIVPSLEERYGGPSKSVFTLSSTLALSGHTVDLLATGPGLPRVEKSLGLKFFPRDWPQSICPSRGLRDCLATAPADVVHHHSLWLRTLHYAHRCAHQRGVPLVISPRGMMSAWAWHHHGWRKRLARHVIHPGALEAAAGWHATSHEEAAEIKALGFNQPICIAPNGVAAPAPSDTAAALAHWQKICPETTQRPVALFYSRFHQKKRVVELIDLWLEHGPRDWLLLLVGLPEDYTPEMLERYVLRASGAGRVRAFNGAGQPPPYPIASLFLLPSHSENFGLVVAEALAHGVPVIVTDSTPWRSVNTVGAGWCVPWADFLPTLRAAVSEAGPRLRARGLLAREWVLREYSWEKSARLLANFYDELRSRPRVT